MAREDHGAVSPHVHEVNSDKHVSNDMSEIPVEHQRPRHGDGLWRVLNERQINMIAFSGTIGNGLFLGTGKSIAAAGPGGAVLAYALVGTAIAAVISCLGEMTALMPVNAPAMEFPRRFLDRGFGFAIGWIYWFAEAVIAANELVAITNAMRFRYDDGKTVLSWPVGESVDPAVWLLVFLVLVTLINFLPVQYFGELEYIFGIFKLVFIIMLIVMMLVLNIMTPRAEAYYSEPIGAKYWNAPYSFFNPEYHVKDDNGNLQRVIQGATGTFLGVWTTCIRVVFSYVGMETFVATAAESKALANSESMKMASRKISIRIITLYCLAVLLAGMMVPVDHPFINGGGQSLGSQSPFIIAVVEAGMPRAAHFFNAVFIFSPFTAAINTMYVSSRILHTLALRDQTGPEWITKRLRQCRSGVPIRAIIATGAVMLLAFMGRNGRPGLVLSELGTNCTVSFLMLYIAICATYLHFYRALEDIKENENLSEAQAASYDRDHPRYPYKSHGQWLKGGYGLAACCILLLFNGITPFLENHFNYKTFIVSYIGIPVFALLIMGYKINRHGFNFRKWGPERSNDIRNAIQTASEVRKGRLEFPDHGFTKENARIFVNWVWVWMK